MEEKINIRQSLNIAEANTRTSEHFLSVRQGREFKAVSVTPLEQENDDAIVIIPGFSEGISQVRQAAIVAANETKRPVVGLEINLGNVASSESAEVVPIYLRDEVMTLAEKLTSSERLTAIGHSAGNIAISHVASFEPIFDKVIAWSGAGLNLLRHNELDNSESFWERLAHFQNAKTLIRFIGMTSIHGARRLGADADWQGAGFLKNSVKKLLEAHPMTNLHHLIYIARTSVLEDVTKAQNQGVRFGIAHGEHDTIFPERELHDSRAIEVYGSYRQMKCSKACGHFPMGSLGGLRQLRNDVLPLEAEISKPDLNIITSVAE